MSCPVLWSSQVLEKFSNFLFFLSKFPLETSIQHPISLGVLQECLPSSPLDLCNNHVQDHQRPPKSSERSWLLPMSPSVWLGFSCPPLSEMEPTSVLYFWICCLILSFLEHMNSLPSALPQKPRLPNLLLLFIPFMILQLVHIFLVNPVPHPGERLQWGPH